MTQSDRTATMVELDQVAPHWRSLLPALAPMGVADSQHLQTVSGLSRDQVDTSLAHLAAHVAAGAPPLLTPVTDKIARPGRTGRARKIYRLEAEGAALLRALGQADARPCGLTTPLTIAHALAVLDVRVAALAAQLPVTTDRTVRNAANQVVRPDNLVTLPGGTRALFEVEQVATAALLPRIVESVRNKTLFWAGGAPADISPVVRLLLAVAPGRDLEHTIARWQSALAAAAAEHSATPWRLAVQPLEAFLRAPDWSEPPDAARWRMLAPPAPPVAPANPAPTAPAPRLSMAELRPYTGRQSVLLLRAILNTMQTIPPPDSATPELARPDRTLFDVTQLVYLAGHPPQAPVQQQAGVPWASVLVLREYLRLHPQLSAALQGEMQPSARSNSAQFSMVTHRMLLVAEKFLRYHGYRPDGPLHVWAASAGWNDTESRPFYIGVRVHDPRLLADPATGLAPTIKEIERAIVALRWVLNALFIYAPQLGLPRPAYW